MLLLLGIPIDSVNGLIPQNDYSASQPFANEQSKEIKHQKIIFHPIEQNVTDVTFLHSEIRVPYKHPALHLNQTDDFIHQLSEASKKDKTNGGPPRGPGGTSYKDNGSHNGANLINTKETPK